MPSTARLATLLFACLPALATAQTTGTFGACDPVIHDKLVGAEWRSPSDCEVKFDAYARQGLTAALQPVIASLTANGWALTRSVELQPINSTPRHTENKPYQLDEQQMHQGGAFFVQLGLDKNSAAFQQADAPLQTAMQKFGAAMKSVNAADLASSQEQLRDATRTEEEHTAIGIRVSINQSSVGIPNFKGGHTVTPLPTGGFAVSAPNVQPLTGGDESAAQRVTYVFVGPFTPPAPAASSAGDETIRVSATPLSTAPTKSLSVQNVVLRIQTGTDLAQQVIRLTDWNALRQLMAGK